HPMLRSASSITRTLAEPSMRSLARPRAVDILGARVDDVTYPEALAILLEAIDARVPHVVTTPNPEFVMLARRNAAFRGALNRAALNIPDGIGLVLAARLAGERLREHVQGTDLVLMLAAESARAGHRWFLLGGVPGAAEVAAGAALGQARAFRVAAPPDHAALALAPSARATALWRARAGSSCSAQAAPLGSRPTVFTRV